MNASVASFPLGHTVIFNVSSATFVAKFGKIATQVKPGQSVTVKPPRAGSGNYPVAIDCTYSGDTTPIALRRSTWQHEANARQILFVTPMPQQKNPCIWGVLDRPAPLEKTKDN